jgi:uncharacterized membrane protein YeaQ/YmgE (transglycosylase-associated protein family)
MEWLLVAIVGSVVGLLIGFFAEAIRMPQSLSVVLGVAGSLAGAGIVRVSSTAFLGPWSFYVAATLGAICLLSGGILAFSLTQDEHRI